jgi:hypothetical protein
MPVADEDVIAIGWVLCILTHHLPSDEQLLAGA